MQQIYKGEFTVAMSVPLLTCLNAKPGKARHLTVSPKIQCPCLKNQKLLNQLACKDTMARPVLHVRWGSIKIPTETPTRVPLAWIT